MQKQYELLDNVLTDIERDIKSVSLANLSKKYAISEVHLRRLFAFIFRRTISGYIRSRKLAASIEDLLKTNHKILDIALGYGFDYEQSYNRTFKREFGLTPGELRKSKQTVNVSPIPKLFHTDKLGDSILIGNIINSQYMSEPYFGLINIHCDILTTEDALKPESIAPVEKGGEYRWNTPQKTGSVGADRIIDHLLKNNIKVHGHVLVWHRQTPAWMWMGSREEVKTNLVKYIQDVLGHFKGRIKSWDVVNEAIRDGLVSVEDWKDALRTQDNPWYSTLGADYIETAFRTARKADSEITLYYNDYDLDNQNKADAVCKMIKDINTRYRAEGNERNLIEGIGIQSHYYSDSVNIDNAEKAINKFIDIGIEISISELDVRMGGYDSDYNSRSTGMSTPLSEKDALVQAEVYVSLFKLYRKYREHIKRVSLWGLDDKNNYQSKHNPCLFDRNLNPKKAFFALMEYLAI